jgi:autotransporter-associated beta strand protein
LTVDGGTLTLSAADRLSGGPAVTVAPGATLVLTGDETAASLLLQGGLGGSGTLTAASYTIDGGTADANLGAGALHATAASLLNGTSAANTLSIDSGTLTLGAASRLLALPVVSVAGAAALALGGNEVLGSLSGSGTLGLGAATLTTGAAGASEFSGSITGAGALLKRGSSTFTLTGSNTYTGSTTVAEGTLQIGNGGTAGSVTSSDFTLQGTLSFQHSDNVALAQAVSGTGGIEQAGSGRLTLSGNNKSYTGTTLVSHGELATAAAADLPAASALVVAADGRATLGGSQTLLSVNADGPISLGGDLTATQDLLLRGALTVNGGIEVLLKGRKIDAPSDGNIWGSRLNIDAGDSVTLSSGSGSGGLRNLVLGKVTAANGGKIQTGVLTLDGALTVNGGTLELAASAPQTFAAPGSELAGKQATSLPIAFADDLVAQTSASTLSVAATAGLKISVAATPPGGVSAATPGAGSVQLLQAGNSFLGSLSVVSGLADAPWSANATPATAGGGAASYAVQSRVRINGTTVNVGGDGVVADVVSIRADQLATVGSSATIVARLPFDSTVGTVSSFPALTLELTPQSYNLSFPFGASGDGNGIRVNVGSKALGNRSLPLDAGYVTALPRGGAKGSTAVLLTGPAVNASGGYRFFFDGAGNQSEIPIFYNGVLPTTPQVESSLSAALAGPEQSRKERFEEAVRTENVSVRLRAGVIAEVGPAPSATQGTEGVRPPFSCEPLPGKLRCNQP